MKDCILNFIGSVFKLEYDPTKEYLESELNQKLDVKDFKRRIEFDKLIYMNEINKIQAKIKSYELDC